jgi:hypothetical protein
MQIKWLQLSALCSIISAVSLLMAGSVCGQWVREDDTSNVFFNDGVYLTQESFFANRPSHSLRTLNSGQWKTADSLVRLGIFAASPLSLRFSRGNLDVRSRFIALVDSQGVSVVHSIDSVWGIALNGIPYKYIENAADEQFVRIPIIGTISFLTYVILERDVPDFNTVSFPSPGYRRIERQWIVDFEKEILMPFGQDYLYEVLQRDPELTAKFEHERKKRRALLPYIRKYNHRHPYQVP